MAAQVLWTHPDHGPIAIISSGSRKFRTANFLDVPNTGLKMTQFSKPTFASQGIDKSPAQQSRRPEIQHHDFSLRPAQLAFTRNALVRLGRMFDPILKRAAGSWRSFRHHVRSARCIDRSTGSAMKFHLVTDRELVGHCLDF
jgi:hypothetical protein